MRSILLACKTGAMGNPEKLHVKSASTYCNNRRNKYCTIFVTFFFLISVFGFKKIMKLLL